MRLIGGDFTGQVKEDGCGVFVCRDGFAEGYVAEMLEGIGEGEVCRGCGFPQAIAFGEFFRG